MTTDGSPIVDPQIFWSNFTDNTPQVSYFVTPREYCMTSNPGRWQSRIDLNFLKIGGLGRFLRPCPRFRHYPPHTFKTRFHTFIPDLPSVVRWSVGGRDFRINIIFIIIILTVYARFLSLCSSSRRDSGFLSLTLLDVHKSQSDYRQNVGVPYLLLLGLVVESYSLLSVITWRGRFGRGSHSESQPG